MTSSAPSYAQRISLRILADGGFVDEGKFGQSCPRLYAFDGRLFSLIARQTLDVLRERGWVAATPGPLPQRSRYTATRDGLAMAREHRP